MIKIMRQFTRADPFAMSHKEDFMDPHGESFYI